MPDDRLEPVLAIVTTLARKAAGGDYIFRGETRCYPKVSSSLYRELQESSPGRSETVLTGLVEAVQQSRLLEAGPFAPDKDELEILTELQHFGGKTNLIDFTTDCFIALFFACDGNHLQDGRVVFLERSATPKDHILEPFHPLNRVIAQKSIFVRPPAGFVEPDDTVVISAQLKAPLLSYLRRCHGISARAIYNDLHGYIRYAAIHQEAFARLSAAQACLNREDYQEAIEGFSQALELNPQLAGAYNGRGAAYGNLGKFDLAIADFTQAIALDTDYAVAYGNRGITYSNKDEFDLAIADFTQAIDLNQEDAFVYSDRGVAYHKQDDYLGAIEDYTRAIDRNPDYAAAYCNRGEAWLHLGEWEKAKADLTAAKAMGFDISVSFHNDYESVAAFEQQHGIQVPSDIAEMLGG